MTITLQITCSRLICRIVYIKIGWTNSRSAVPNFISRREDKKIYSLMHSLTSARFIRSKWSSDRERDGGQRPRSDERASERAAFYRSARLGDLRVHASRASNEHMSCYLRAGHYSLPDLLYFMLRGWTRDSFGSDRTPITSPRCVPALQRSSPILSLIAFQMAIRRNNRRNIQISPWNFHLVLRNTDWFCNYRRNEE